MRSANLATYGEFRPLKAVRSVVSYPSVEVRDDNSLETSCLENLLVIVIKGRNDQKEDLVAQ